MVKKQNEKQQIIKRPIFENLYNLMYKSDPTKWRNLNYNNFLESIRDQPKIEDMKRIDIDEFTKKIELIKDEYKEEVDIFEQLQLGQDKKDVGNDIELLNFIDISRGRLKPDITDVLKKFLSESFQPQTTYVPMKRKHRFNLNNEKTVVEMEERQGQPNLIDDVCHKQRLDQE